MKFAFRGGVPKEAINWLNGNVPMNKWSFRRQTDTNEYGEEWHTPYIFIEDEQFALLFALIWGGK